MSEPSRRTEEQMGSFVDAEPGESATFPTAEPTGGSASGSGDPEVITGDTRFDPRTIPIDNGDSRSTAREPRRKRDGSIDGRTLRGKRSKEDQQGLSALIDFAGVLLSVHAMLAAMTHFQELELDDSEATKLADGIKKVLAYHNVPIDPKKLAYVNLSMIAMEIYGPRVLLGVQRLKERQPRQTQSAPPQPQNVRPMTPKKEAPFQWTPPADTAPSQVWKEPAL